MTVASTNHPPQDASDLQALRRALSKAHDDLRSSGFGPLEAATAVARALSGETGTSPADARAVQALGGMSVTGNLLAVVYQEFLAGESRSGLGQFLTPLEVSEFIAARLRREAPTQPTVLDPFCGAGVLLDCMGRVLPGARLRGIEINQGIAEMAWALGRLMASDFEVELGDSFARLAKGDLPEVDIVVTNPPFGTDISREQIESLLDRVPAALSELGRIPAELLGIEVSLEALKPNGQMAIVLPQSILTNSRWSDYRASLCAKATIDAIVSLPEETFAPFKGVARSCIIFAHKAPSVPPVSIPFLRSRAIGYDEVGRPSGVCDLPDLVEDEDRPIATLETTGVVRLPTSTPFPDCEVIRLGDIADVFAGRTPSAKDYCESGPFLLKVGNLSDTGLISWVDRKRSRVAQRFYDRSGVRQLRPGDICLTAAAHKPRYIGAKVNLIDTVPAEGAVASAEVLVIRAKGDAAMSAEGIFFFLRSDAGYQQLQDRVRGATAHLYAKDVVEMVVPLPSDPDATRVAGELLAQSAVTYRHAEHLRAAAYAQVGLADLNAEDTSPAG